jgi:hypothetical protein
MATRNKIVRLSARIDALASRRFGKLTLDSLTDEAWEKIERISAESASSEPIHTRIDHSQWSNDALIRILIDGGVLTPADFKTSAGT